MERKLSAILDADVEGYSRLMGDDEAATVRTRAALNADVQGDSRLIGDGEAATVRTINAYRDLMALLIRDHHGRMVDFTCANPLAEFASAVDRPPCRADAQN